MGHNFTWVSFKALSRRYHSRIARILVFLWLFSGNLNAQVATYYNFSQSNGTYTPIVADPGTTPADIYTVNWDDIAYTFPLPFNFTFNGVLYNAGTGYIGLDTDAWFCFSNGVPTMTGQLGGGSWVSTSNQTGVYLNGTANNNGFAGLNCDLNNQSFATFTANTTAGSNVLTGVSSVANITVGTRLGGTGIPNGTVVISNTANTITMSANAISTSSGIAVTPSSSIYYKVIGTAPNRQLVVQWTQAKRYGGTGTDNFNFQMLINEGGGIPQNQTLQVIYGGFSATSTTNLEAQVGLRGASTADFNARTSSTGWAVTIAATANTQTVRMNNSIMPASGLTFTWSPCTVAPGAAGAISGATTVCSSSTQTYSIAPVAGATSYTWTYSGSGASFSATTSTPSNSFVFSAAPTGGTITVTPVNLCGSGASSSLAISIASPALATISYPSSSYCTSFSGNIAVTQTGPAGGTYSTNPSSGLTIVSSSGQITPSSSTAGIYTVTYSYTSAGCNLTTATTVTINQSPTVTVSASPATLCSGSSSQLTASVPSSTNYTVSSIAHSSLAPSGSPTVLWNTNTDDGISAAIALPFSFSFYGNAITQLFVSTNGHVQLQASSGVANAEQTLPNATTPNNVIALAWDDLVVDPSTNSGSQIRHFTNGTAPNRVFVVDFVNLRFIGGTGAQNVTGQIRLYESDSHIEIAATTVNDSGTSRNKTMGIENSTGTIGLSPAGRNNVVWNVSNEAWAFYPPSGEFTYSWSPSTFLSSTSIFNPVANNVTAPITYTVTVTQPSSGCATTSNVSVALSNVGSTGAISGATSVCPGTSQSYSIPAVTNATSYTWTYSGAGASFTASTATPSNTFNYLSGATSGTITVTPSNACGSGAAASLAITVTTVTTATISYPSAAYCSNTTGTISVNRTGPAGGTFTVNPSGLSINASTGAITPSSSTVGIYTVTYTYSSSPCSGLATATNVTIHPSTAVTTSAVPSTICSGSNAQLTATVTSSSNYSLYSIAHSSLAPSGSPTVLWSVNTDDAISSAIALPFSFSFYGNAITQLFVSTNGHIQLQTSSGFANTEQTLPSATTPNNVIALAWDDLVVDPSSNTGSLIRHFTNGTAPNRVFVVDYVNLRFVSGSGAQNVTGQIRLYESDSHIEVAATTVNDNSTNRTKTLGIENSTGTIGLSPAGRNNVVWNTSNEAWAFYPPSGTFTYAWSPTTFLSNSSIVNPMANAVTAATTYTVTATNASTGCPATSNVTVSLSNVGLPGTLSGPASVCPGTSQSYSIPAVTNATSYSWAYSGAGASFTASTVSPSNTINFLSGASSGNLTVTPSNACGSGTAASLTITITSVSTATISYPSSAYCTNTTGTISVNRTGPAGGTFTANPSGLSINASTGAITPSSSTAGIYTVTYNYNSSPCSGLTTSTAVTIHPSLTATASATPSTVCPGSTSQLTATVTSSSNYSVYSIAHSSLVPSGTPTVVWSVFTDDALSSAIPLPFGFSFYGNAITQLFVSSNGHVQLQTGSGTANAEQTLPNATTPNNVIALAWDDLVVDPATNTGSQVRYFTNGNSPNRIFVVDYVNLRFFSGTGARTVTGQIRLYEADGHIEVAATTVNDNGANLTKTLGIENSTGTIGLSPAGRNNVVWNVSNEAWAFYPPAGTFSYAWSPGALLSNTAISNPVASGVTTTTTFTVSVTGNTTGCSVSAGTTLTYTAGLNGTYTVGVGGSYTTLTAAINAYNTQCVSGPIVFSLIDNSYPSETFPIVINSNSAASAVNTLTIRPASGRTPVITGSSSTAIIRLNGADYVTIDGSNSVGGSSRNLTLINTNTGTATTSIIWLNSVSTGNGSTNNIIRNCIFTGNSSTTTNSCVISSSSVFGDIAQAANSNNTYTNNEFTRAQTAIAVVGPVGNESNCVISNNLIGSTTAASKLGFSGIEIYQQANCLVTGNTIFGVTTNSSSITTSGITVLGTHSNVTISSNRISDIKNTNTGGYGCNGIQLEASTTASNITVANNMIFDVAGYGFTDWLLEDNGYGIVVNGGGGYRIYNNTVVLNTNQSVSGYPAAFHVTYLVNTAGSIDLRNNIFGNTQTQVGQHYAIQADASNTVFSNIDYNDYYVASGNLGYIGASNRATLANIQAGFGGNLNSRNVTPVFVAANDYHINTSNATNIANLSNNGITLTGVVQDFDSQTRNPLTPDIGCDEWVEPNKGSWVGLVSTDWLTPANWEANFVPDGNTDVFITGGYTFMPTINAPASQQAVRNLTLTAPGAPTNVPILTITNDTLVINGTITRTGGSVVASSGTVQMNGTAAQTIPANLFQNNNLRHLVIGNSNNVTGVTLGGVLDIYGSVTFTSTGLRLTTNDNLTFKSNLSGTAWLGNVTGKTITGNATVERYIPTGVNHGKSWQFVSVPLSGTQTINQAWQDTATAANQNRYSGFGTQLVTNTSPLPLLFDASGVAPSIKTYDPASNAWVGVPNTTGTPIANKRGYMVFVRGDRSVTTVGGAAVPTVLRAKGKLYTTGADLPPLTNVPADKFESIGNPYASAIDFMNIGKPGPAQVDDVFYVWDPLRFGHWGFGNYQTISSINGYKPVPGGTANYNATVMNTRIESGQAFFVHATGPSSGGNITFTEAAKLSGSQMVFRDFSSSLAGRGFLAASLIGQTSSGTYLADGNVAAFDTDFSNAYDHHDAFKMTNPGENFSILAEKTPVAIEARASVTENDTIHYQLQGLRRQTYSFAFAPQNLQSTGLSAFLGDRFLGLLKPVSLSDSSFISFTVTDQPGSFAPDRFYVVFRPLQTVPVSFADISAIRKSEYAAVVRWAVDNEIRLSHYELQKSADGRSFEPVAQIRPRNNSGGAFQYDFTDDRAGSMTVYYRVRAVDEDGSYRYSRVVRVGPVKAVPQISVAPNPISDGIIRVQVEGQAAGSYQIALYNQLGQLVLSEAARLSDSRENLVIRPLQGLAPGMYELRLTIGNREFAVARVLVN